MTKKYTVTIKIKPKQIIDLFISACEGGSNYWCKELTPVGRKGDAYEAMLAGFKVIELEITKDGDFKTHVVNREMIQNALGLFPVKAPHAFTAWLTEDWDAETADCFLQLCVFGDIIYG